VEFIHEDDGSVTARDLETFLIVVPHETPVIDLVPERGGRVQQVP
jgi:hypothetical protein